MSPLTGKTDRWPLADAIAILEKAYGRPPKPPVTDPFEMIVWESCAYLVDDARRAEVFARIRDRIGLSPRGIAGVPDSVLVEALEGSGMRPPDRAARLKRCAEIAEEIGIARLRSLVKTDPAAARKLLKKFPGIADPGADKILLYNGAARTLAPDSNALRVLVRLGFAKMEKDYGRVYRSAAESTGSELPSTLPKLIAARELLRRHGQEVCKRNNPRCEVCPLSARCEAFRTKSFATF
jgi:endonuclease-3